MYKGITLRAFPPEMDTRQRLELARAAGYQGVEINLEPGEEYTLDSDKAQLISLRRELERMELGVVSVYSRQQWYYPISSQEPGTRQKGKWIIERLAWAATILGAEAVLVVPGAVDNRLFVQPPEIVPYSIAYQNAQTVLREILADAGGKYPVYFAIENVWNKFLQSPFELARFVDELDSPWAGIYFDVGNVLRIGYPEHWIPVLGDRIKRVHLKDFRLSVDTVGGFVQLLEGDVNWPGVRMALEEIDYKSWVTAEVLPAYRYHGERLIYETSASMDVILDSMGRTDG